MNPIPLRPKLSVGTGTECVIREASAFDWRPNGLHWEGFGAGMGSAGTRSWPPIGGVWDRLGLVSGEDGRGTGPTGTRSGDPMGGSGRLWDATRVPDGSDWDGVGNDFGRVWVRSGTVPGTVWVGNGSGMGPAGTGSWSPLGTRWDRLGGNQESDKKCSGTSS